MLEKIREGSQSFVSKTILSLIIASFMMTGLGSYLYNKQDNIVAEVNDTQISESEYQRAYQAQLNQLKSQYAELYDMISADDNYLNQIKTKVLNQMIDEALLKQYAVSLDMTVSQKSLLKTIVGMPEFRIDDTFNSDRYVSILKQAGMKPAAFETYLRHNLIQQQLLNVLNQSQLQVRSDMWSINRLLTQTREFKYTVLERDMFANDIQNTDAELTEYYQDHIESFRKPEQFALEYIRLRVEDLKREIQVSEQDIQLYYQQNKQLYLTQERRQVAHILFGLDQLEKAEATLKAIQTGQSFKDAARQWSQDTATKEQGGELPWIVEGEMPAAFDKVAFELTTADPMSSVVTTESGFHIIQLLAIEASEPLPLAQVKPNIVENIKDKQATQSFHTLKQTLTDASYENASSLASSKTDTKLPIQTTGLFTTNSIPAFLNTAAVRKALYSKDVLDNRLNSEVVELADQDVVVFRIATHQPAQIETFEVAKSKIEQSLVAQKTTRKLERKVSEIVDSLASGQQASIDFKQHTLKRDERVAGLNPQVLAKVFTMPNPEGSQPSIASVALNNGTAIVVLNKVNSITNIQDKVVNQYQNNVKQRAINMELTALIRHLQNNGSVDKRPLLVATE
jgi:peptidyl-prolyl cis-trans isomerase D